MVLIKAAAMVAAAGVAAAGSGVTIAQLERQVKTLQHQVRVLDRTAVSYGMRINNGPQLVCIRDQAPDYGRQVTVLANYHCVVSG